MNGLVLIGEVFAMEGRGEGRGVGAWGGWRVGGAGHIEPTADSFICCGVKFSENS